jgi:uncharacterized protein
VRLAPGSHHDQLEQLRGILMGLNEDSLLRQFRLAAGLNSPGNDLGGWYGSAPYLGQTFGQWLCALSRVQTDRTMQEIPDGALTAGEDRESNC